MAVGGPLAASAQPRVLSSALLAYLSSRGPGWCSLFPGLSSLLIFSVLQLHTPAAQDIIKVSLATQHTHLPSFFFRPLHSGHQPQMIEGEQHHHGKNVLHPPNHLSNNTLHFGKTLLNLAEIFHINARRASATGRLFTRVGWRFPLGFQGNAIPQLTRAC